MKTLVMVIFALLLSACATALDSQSQRITFDLVNMQKARCEVYNHQGIVKSRSYIFQLPGTYNVERSIEDLHIDCLGLKGLEVKLVVPSQLNETANHNVTNLGLGVGVDAASQALFKYPDRIVVDFTQAVLSSQNAQNQAMPTNITAYDADPSVSSNVDMGMMEEPLCDGDENAIRCAHKVYNPGVSID